MRDGREVIFRLRRGSDLLAMVNASAALLAGGLVLAKLSALASATPEKAGCSVGFGAAYVAIEATILWGAARRAWKSGNELRGLLLLANFAVLSLVAFGVSESMPRGAVKSSLDVAMMCVAVVGFSVIWGIFFQFDFGGISRSAVFKGLILANSAVVWSVLLFGSSGAFTAVAVPAMAILGAGVVAASLAWGAWEWLGVASIGGAFLLVIAVWDTGAPGLGIWSSSFVLAEGVLLIVCSWLMGEDLRRRTARLDVKTTP